MKAMIFAAGVGSRLKPFTDKAPKALVELAGKTLLQHNIEKIKALGITEIVVNVHHFANTIKNYLTENNNFGVNVFISDESDVLLDTGGGLKKAKGLLQGSDQVLLQNVDIYSDIDYKGLIKYHNNSGSMATLAIKKRNSSRYLLFDNKFKLCGWRNDKTGEEIVPIKSKPLSNFAFSGIHIINQELLNYLLPDKKFGMIQQYLKLIENHQIAGYLHSDDNWFDIGSPEKLQKAEEFSRNNNL